MKNLNVNQNQEENQVSNFEYKINYGWHDGVKWSSKTMDHKPSDEEIKQELRDFQASIREEYKNFPHQYMRITMAVYQVKGDKSECLYHTEIDNFKLY